jgi:transposase-like protein
MWGLVSLAEVFKGRHFDAETIVLCVRWHLQYKLSYRDLVAMMADAVSPSHPARSCAGVRHYTPEFEKRWNRFARPVGGSWRADETFIKVRGRWVCGSLQIALRRRS